MRQSTARSVSQKSGHTPRHQEVGSCSGHEMDIRACSADKNPNLHSKLPASYPPLARPWTHRSCFAFVVYCINRRYRRTAHTTRRQWETTVTPGVFALRCGMITRPPFDGFSRRSSPCVDTLELSRYKQNKTLSPRSWCLSPQVKVWAILRAEGCTELRGHHRAWSCENEQI